MSSSVFESRNARARAREIGGWTQDVMTQGTGQKWGQLKLFFLRTKSFVGKIVQKRLSAHHDSICLQWRTHRVAAT